MLLKTPSPTIKAILFDMDGTLLDTETLSDKAIIEVFGDSIPSDIRQNLNHKLPWDIKEPTLGKRGDEWIPMVIEYAVKHWGVVAPPSTHEFWNEQEAKLNSYCSEVEECKGASALVESLAETGIPMAIATSSRLASVRKKRTRHERIFKHMHTVVTGDDPAVTNGKPAPDIYLEAARRLNVHPSECLVFEDAIAGCQSGKAAGCSVVAVPDPRMQDRSPFDGIADQVLDDLTCFDAKAWRIGQQQLN